MNVPVLSIGGPADGRRQIMEEPLPTYWYTKEFSGGYTASKFPKITNHIYRLERLSIKEAGTVRAVYVHSSVEDWISALIDGYRSSTS